MLFLDIFLNKILFYKLLIFMYEKKRLKFECEKNDNIKIMMSKTIRLT